MKVRKFKIFISLCLLLFWSSSSAQGSLFDIEGKSMLFFVNQTHHSIDIKLRSFTTWPYKDNQLKKTLLPNDQLKLEIVNQGRNHAILLIDNRFFNIFIQPGSVDTISINTNLDKNKDVIFSGHAKEINQFQFKKSAYFHSANIDSYGRSQSYLDNYNSYDRIIQINDSITKVNLDYMSKNSSSIPKWYIDFEIKRVRYMASKEKINSVLYRKLFQNLKDPVPPNFIDNAISDINIEDIEMLGNNRYMWFLRDFISFKTEYPFTSDKNKKLKNITRRINIIQSKLSGKVKDAYLASELCGLIDNKLLINSTWINLIEEKQLNKFLKLYSQNYSILPEGANLPYFYLPDTSGIYKESTQFKGEILLINFWNAGCKPCIQDFPHENELVEKYLNEPVTILNICTSPRLWKTMIKKHHLKTVNLLAPENWSEKLRNAFDINSFPHSALVDWNGKIVQNKCPRASSNVDQLIDELLVKMKSG